MNPPTTMLDLAPSQRDHLRAAVHWLAETHGTQAKAATATGIPVSRLAVYGSHGLDSWRVSVELVAKIASACGVDAVALLRGDGPKPSGERRRVHQVRAGRAAGV